MVGPKKKERIFFKNLVMNVSSSKIGYDFSNEVVQKLTQEKK